MRHARAKVLHQGGLGRRHHRADVGEPGVADGVAPEPGHDRGQALAQWLTAGGCVVLQLSRARVRGPHQHEHAGAALRGPP